MFERRPLRPAKQKASPAKVGIFVWVYLEGREGFARIRVYAGYIAQIQADAGDMIRQVRESRKVLDKKNSTHSLSTRSGFITEMKLGAKHSVIRWNAI